MRARNPFRLEHFVKRAVEPVVLKTRFEQRRDFESGRSHGVPPLRRGRFSNSNTRRERTKNRSKTVLKNRIEGPIRKPVENRFENRAATARERYHQRRAKYHSWYRSVEDACSTRPG